MTCSRTVGDEDLMRFRTPSLLTALVAVLLSLTGSPSAADRLQPGASVWLHAHNCYPEKGPVGRSDPARARRADVGHRHRTGRRLVRRSLHRARTNRRLSRRQAGWHRADPRGAFLRSRPARSSRRRCATNRKDTWPVMVLHLDFKTNEPAHHQAVWDLLGKYESWLTTAERVADEQRVTPFTAGSASSCSPKPARTRPTPSIHASRSAAGCGSSGPSHR